jgi:nitrogen fixation protein
VLLHFSSLSLPASIGNSIQEPLCRVRETDLWEDRSLLRDKILLSLPSLSSQANMGGVNSVSMEVLGDALILLPKNKLFLAHLRLFFTSCLN